MLLLRCLFAQQLLKLLFRPLPQGRNPTKSTSEAKVPIAKDSMPWETGHADSKYQYHPHGDAGALKDAPSAVNVVVVPNVNLPKVILRSYDAKFVGDGKRLTDDGRTFTRSGTSGARTATKSLLSKTYLRKHASRQTGVECCVNRFSLAWDRVANRSCIVPRSRQWP